MGNVDLEVAIGNALVLLENLNLADGYAVILEPDSTLYKNNMFLADSNNTHFFNNELVRYITAELCEKNNPVILNIVNSLFDVDYKGIYVEPIKYGSTNLGVIFLGYSSENFSVDSEILGIVSTLSQIIGHTVGSHKERLRLELEVKKYKEFFKNANDAIFLHEINENGMPGPLNEVNDTACDKWAYTLQEFLSMTPMDLKTELDVNHVKTVSEIISTNKTLTFETFDTKKDGERFPVEISAHSFELGGRKMLISIARDITERKKFEDELIFLSHRDSLTGLYNRRFFEDELKKIEDGHFTNVGLIVCDIDNLKFINDTIGHDAGDEMIVNTAKLLLKTVGLCHTVARIGGDEYAILLSDTSDTAVEKLSNNIRTAFNNYNAKFPIIPLTISVGHSFSNKAPLNPRTLFRTADNNMYIEKYKNAELRSKK